MMKRLTKKERAAIESRCYLILDAARELRMNYPTIKYVSGSLTTLMDIKKAARLLLSGLTKGD